MLRIHTIYLLSANTQRQKCPRGYRFLYDPIILYMKTAPERLRVLDFGVIATAFTYIFPNLKKC